MVYVTKPMELCNEMIEYRYETDGNATPFQQY